MDFHATRNTSPFEPTHLPAPASWSAPAPAAGSLQRWRAPGTCGELLQGAVDGRDFMVNCPINLFATAQAFRGAGRAPVRVRQAQDYAKVQATLDLLLQRRGAAPGTQGVEIALHSPIPRSKGMASSTADAAAALAAYAASRDLVLGETEAARLLTAVEPSDCTQFSGIAHVDFITGKLIERLPAPHGLKVLVVDCGGEVQTLAFDRDRARAVYARQRERLVAALRLIKRGLRAGDNRQVAQAATESTALSQLILPKAQLPELLALAGEWGLLGINCAHSGTVLGLLYEGAFGQEACLRERIARRFGAALPVIGAFDVIGGGTRAVA